MDENGWDEARPVIQTEFMSGLDENARELYLQARMLDGGCALLQFLHSRSNSLLTADDIAYHLRQPGQIVERNLRRLVELGWARRVDLGEMTWFGLANDPQRRNIVQALGRWQELWFKRLLDLQHLIMPLDAPLAWPSDAY